MDDICYDENNIYGNIEFDSVIYAMIFPLKNSGKFDDLM